MKLAPATPSAKAPTPPQARVSRNNFLLLHGTLLLYAGVSVLAKYAGIHLALQETTSGIVFMVLEFLALGVYAVLWQQTLKRMPLGYAYSNKGVVTLWSYLFGLFFFGETLTLGKAVGILVVLTGVWLVVSDHD